jgi:DNA-binding ferritin-like protein
MNMLDSALDNLAERILSLDEASLSSLWKKYKSRMEHFEPSKEWEKAVIIFFIINAVRAKNHIFNEQILRQSEAGPEKKQKKKPDLRLVK